MQRSAAIALLRQYVHGDTLVRYCLATGSIMKAVAGPLGGDPAGWEEIGILHDIDFEQVNGGWKNPEGSSQLGIQMNPTYIQPHGVAGARLLTDAGIADDSCGIIAGHNHFLHIAPYETPMEIALQAADNASGLITACALVKGGRLSDVTMKTITKKAKEKSFAAGCDRNRIAFIAPLMEIPVFYGHALAGLMEIRTELGLE